MTEDDLEFNRQLERIFKDLSEVLSKREHVVRPGHPAPEKKQFHKHGKTYLVLRDYVK